MTSFRKGDWVVVAFPSIEIKQYRGYFGKVVNGMGGTYTIHLNHNQYGDFYHYELILAPPLVLAMHGISLDEERS